MSHPPKSTMRAPCSTCRSYKGVRLPKNFSSARPRCAPKREWRRGNGDIPRFRPPQSIGMSPIYPRRPSVLEPERSGSRWIARRTPSVDARASYRRPSLSRTRLRSLPFFCLSVSGRKPAPSAPSLKRVSRTESGQLASGWHHSSPSRTAQREFGRDCHENAPHHASADLDDVLICCRDNDVRHCPSRKTTARDGARTRSRPPKSPASPPT